MDESPLCSRVKLWHPRGPQVTLPLPTDPRACLEAVSHALDLGWLVAAPGLEEGEEKETVGWVLKGIHSNENQETPFVLLYSTNDALKWSFLKVYLNDAAMIEAFEYASRMKLDVLPEYVGQDKPQRGNRTDKFIIAAPRPFQVVFRKNPKHDDTEAGKMKPARLFVRWADQKPQTPAEADPLVEIEARPPTLPASALPARKKQEPAKAPIDRQIAAWAEFLGKSPTLEEINEECRRELPLVKPLTIKQQVWKLVTSYADKQEWVFDTDQRLFTAPAKEGAA